MAPPTRAPKVAVVGSGLAGLTAANLLQNEADKGRPVEVHLFEKVSFSEQSRPRNRGSLTISSHLRRLRR